MIQDAEGVLRKCEPLVRVIPKPQLGFRNLLLGSRRHPNVLTLNPPFCFKQLELIEHPSLLLQSVKLIKHTRLHAEFTKELSGNPLSQLSKSLTHNEEITYCPTVRNQERILEEDD